MLWLKTWCHARNATVRVLHSFMFRFDDFIFSASPLSTKNKLNLFFLYLILGALKRNAFGVITMWGTEPIESINANHSGEAFARFTNEALSAAEQSVKSRRRLHNRYGFIPRTECRFYFLAFTLFRQITCLRRTGTNTCVASRRHSSRQFTHESQLYIFVSLAFVFLGVRLVWMTVTAHNQFEFSWCESKRTAFWRITHSAY